MTTGSAGILFPSAELIRKGVTGGVFIAPYSSAAISTTNLFDPTTGALVNPLPSGYRDLGFLSTAGAVFARTVKTTDIASWQSDVPTRTDVTSDTSVLTVVPQETNQSTLSAYLGIAAGSVLTPGANGTFQYSRPSVPVQTYWRILALSVDETTYGEVVFGRFFPRALVTAYANQSMANASDPIEWGVSITAYLDSVLGTPEVFLFGGEGQTALQTDSGWSRTVTCTVATTTTLTATTGSFYPWDVGAVVSGTGITVGTTIFSYTSATVVIMSAVGTAPGTAIVVTIAAQN